MSEENGNTLKYRLDQVERNCQTMQSAINQHKDDDQIFFRTVINPFIDKMNVLSFFIEERKSDIKEIPTMKQTLGNIETWIKEERALRRRTTVTLAMLVVTSIVIPILMRLLIPVG